MDMTLVRSLSTVLGLLCFLGIVVWAYSKGSKQRFDEAANLPFADDDLPAATGSHAKQGNAS